tara:strand:+ start:110 stop:340 length:231 start_codon:yes stop_codon:yes gene_type:complete
MGLLRSVVKGLEEAPLPPVELTRARQRAKPLTAFERAAVIRATSHLCNLIDERRQALLCLDAAKKPPQEIASDGVR